MMAAGVKKRSFSQSRGANVLQFERQPGKGAIA